MDFIKKQIKLWSFIVILVIVALYFWFSEDGLERFEVDGDSMSGIVEDGDTVKVKFGYYGENEIERGDIVLYDFVAEKYPLVKRVYGIPFDTFSLEKVGGEMALMVNGSLLKNSEGKLFLFNKKRANLISLYIRDNDGVIPENAYLLLGNIPSGSVDSSSFGLVSRREIIAKVIK